MLVVTLIPKLSIAGSHRNAVEQFDFVVGKVFTRKVFDLTMDVPNYYNQKIMTLMLFS